MRYMLPAIFSTTKNLFFSVRRLHHAKPILQCESLFCLFVRDKVCTYSRWAANHAHIKKRSFVYIVGNNSQGDQAVREFRALKFSCQRQAAYMRIGSNGDLIEVKDLWEQMNANDYWRTRDVYIIDDLDQLQDEGLPFFRFDSSSIFIISLAKGSLWENVIAAIPSEAQILLTSSLFSNTEVIIRKFQR